MIVPSIDLQGGRTVQLVGGREQELDAGDPRPILERFARVGEVAVVDLDAAIGTGDNRELVEELCAMAPVRVGGGIRDGATARRWLDLGAQKIVIGTAAEPALLQQLPPERVIVALDADKGEVVVEGWRKGTGRTVVDRMQELRDLCGGFLVTFVEREGRMGGTDMAAVAALVEAAGDARVTIAGGVTTAEEVGELDRMGADAQVGMSLYKGHMDLADAFLAPAVSDRADGLLPTVVVDPHGVALGLVYSSTESVRKALDTGRGVYHSRKRGVWEKGATSGATQELLGFQLDCDRDALRAVVRQQGEGFCHQGTWTCFGTDGGVPALLRQLARRAEAAPEGSYTRRLLQDPALLRAKLLEEAGELAAAEGAADVAHEAADVIYFAAVAMVRGGVALEDVARCLDQRALKVSRRPGDAKPGALPRAGEAGGSAGD